MTTLSTKLTKDEALKLALEYIQPSGHCLCGHGEWCQYCTTNPEKNRVVNAIREALVQPSDGEDEPVAIVDDAGVIVVCSYKYKPGDKLYTRPQLVTKEATELKPEDLHVETILKQTGGGFAPIGTSGVRVTHLPTGIAVHESSERSQHANRAKAIARLGTLLSKLAH